MKETLNKRDLQINQVEHIHEKSRYQRSLAELLDDRGGSKLFYKVNLNKTTNNMKRKNK